MKINKWILSFIILIFVGLIWDQVLDSFIQFVTMYLIINMILGLGLNLLSGMTGQFSLGHAGFMAAGAYSSAWLSTQVPLLTHIPGGFLVLQIAGGLVAALLGWIVGLPSLRLKGDYLAIVTLGFGEIIRVTLLNMPAVGGARGMYGISSPPEIDLPSVFIVSTFYQNFIYACFWLIFALMAFYRIRFSVHGRSFLAVREDELAANALGVYVTQAKVRAFVLSSFFAGVAGSLFAHFAQYLNPSTFSFQKSVEIVMIVVLGGIGSLTGTIMAAGIVTLLPEFLRPLQEYTGVDLRMVIFSLILIILMIVRPQGLMGHKEITDWFKGKYARK